MIIYQMSIMEALVIVFFSIEQKYAKKQFTINRSSNNFWTVYLEKFFFSLFGSVLRLLQLRFNSNCGSLLIYYMTFVLPVLGLFISMVNFRQFNINQADY